MSSSLIVKVLAFRVFLLCLVSVQGSWGQTQDFVTLKATCYPDSRILVSLQTSEPFEGLLYARNHPSSCRVEGQPALLQPVTQLMMTPQECGIRLGLRSKGYEGVSEAEVYVQHDSFVQQVIDEQFLVECFPGNPEGLVSYQKRKQQAGGRRRPGSSSSSNSGGAGVVRDVIVTSKFRGRQFRKDDSGEEERIDDAATHRRHADDGEEEEEEEEDVEPQLRSEVRENSIVSNLIDSKLDVIAETPKWVEKSEEGEQQEEGDVESLIRLQIREMFEDRDEEEEENTGKNNEGEEEAEKNHDNSGWMELTWPGDEDEDSNLQVGQNVSLVVRLRQAGAHDTMLGDCWAFSKDGASGAVQQQQLTDKRGCSLHKELMDNMQASFNSRTGVKVLRTSFPMFKFPGEPQLNLKCRVNVCRKNCPVTKCSADASSTQASSTAVVIDKFQLETSAMVEDNSRIKNRLESVLKKKKAREAKRRREEEEEEEEEKRILSVEERKEAEEAFIEQQALLEREEGPSVVQKQLPILEDQQLLCLSPSRLILAFGVILFILLLALVFACMLWLRARSKAGHGSGSKRMRSSGGARLRSKSAGANSSGVPGATALIGPPPGLRRGGPYLLPRPGPMGGSPAGSGGGNMPYIRVMQ